MRYVRNFQLIILLLAPLQIFAYHQSLFCPTLTKSLFFGSRGAEVFELQKFLAADHEIYPEGIVSGFFGSLTEKAVKRFQAKYGVVSGGAPLSTGYGVVGPKTRAKVTAICSGVPQEVPSPQPAAPLAPPAVPSLVKPAASLPPTIDLKANDSDSGIKIANGSSVTLSWTLSDHKWSWCNQLRDWSGSMPVPVSSSQVIGNLTASKTFALRCYLGNSTYEDTVVVEVLPKDVSAPPPLPLIVGGSHEGVKCEISADLPVAILGLDPPDTTWKVISDPPGRHLYFHDVVNGVTTTAEAYGGKTNRDKKETYPAVVGKHYRFAHVVADQDHKVSDGSYHPDGVCTTNTAVFEIRGSINFWPRFKSAAASVFDAILRFVTQH